MLAAVSIYPDQGLGEADEIQLVTLAAELGYDSAWTPSLVVAVADVFEAMTAERPYRPAMSEERALAIMRKSSGG